MKRLLALAIFAFALPAHAEYAFLVNCRISNSMSGMVWIGTYVANGQVYTQVFQSWCPQMVEVVR